jgi:hypothetical protein
VPLITGFPTRILGSRDMRSCQLIIDHIMWTIKIYFLRTEDKREAASSDRLPPAGLGPHATGLPRAGRRPRVPALGSSQDAIIFLRQAKKPLCVLCELRDLCGYSRMLHCRSSVLPDPQSQEPPAPPSTSARAGPIGQVGPLAWCQLMHCRQPVTIRKKS